MVIKYRSNLTHGIAAVLGAVIGAIPGTGGAIASYLTYNMAKINAKPDEEF